MKWFKELSKKKRQILASLMAVCLMLTMVPVTSYTALAAMTGTGASAGDSYVVSTGADFKTALQSTANSINYIKLNSCISLSGDAITVSNPVVVDLNGYTIKTASSGTYISGSQSMTFKNGYISAGSTAFFNSKSDYTGPDYVLENLILTNTGDLCVYVGYSGTLNATNCSFTNSSGTTIQGNRNGAVFTLTDCYLKGSEYAYTRSSSTLTLDGVTITGNSSSNVYDGGFANNIVRRHAPLSGTTCTVCANDSTISYDLWIAGKRVTEDNADNLADGAATYDAATNTLTVSGDIAATGAARAISYRGHDTLKVNVTQNVTLSAVDGIAICAYDDENSGALNINIAKGKTLTVRSDDTSYGAIYGRTGVTVTGGTLNVTSSMKYAIYSVGEVTVQNGSTIYATGNTAAIYANGGVDITDSATTGSTTYCADEAACTEQVTFHASENTFKIGDNDAKTVLIKIQDYKKLTIYPYATAMNQSSSTGSMTLAVDLTGSSYQWQVSDTKDGTFTDVSGETEATYTFDTVDGKWYRCVIDGNKITKSVQVLDAENDANKFYSYSYIWYLSNDSLAYALKEKTFDIVGKYSNQWIRTSYSKYWRIDARKDANPTTVSGSSFDGTGVEAIKITFDPVDERKAKFAIDLRDGYQAASVGADTMLYTFDVCPLTAKETRTGALKQIQMVGAENLESATTSNAAFVIKPVTEISSYWIGKYSSRKGYSYNEDTSLLNNSKYTFNHAGTHVTQINGLDSGMTMSWTNVPSGGIVEFEMSVGTVQQTGAILQDPISSTDTMELVVTPGSYYRLVDETGQPATPWVLPDTNGNIVFEQLTPDTLYSIETVSPENYNGGNPDENDIDWLDEVYTKIPIDDTTTDDQSVQITPYCISAEFGNLDFERYTYTVSSGSTPINVPNTGLVTGLSRFTTYTLYAEDKVTYNTSTAAIFTTVDHDYKVAVKQDDTATLVATCDGKGCNDSHELTIVAPTRTVYGDSGSASATLSRATFAGENLLPAIKYVGRAGTTYEESTNAPESAGKYTASITINSKTASVNYEIAKAEPTNITWPTNLSVNAGEKLSSIDLSSYGNAKGILTWDSTDTIVTYGQEDYPMTYTPNDTVNYKTVKQDVKVEGVDDTAPTGKISIDTNHWNRFLNTITFGFFFKETKTVTITAADNDYGSGVKEIVYYCANEKVADIETLENNKWKEYTAFEIVPENKYIIYARITDNADNVTYINTDGIVLFKDTEITTGEYDYTLTTKTDIVTNIKKGNNTIDMIDLCEPGGNAGDMLDYTFNPEGYLVLDGEDIESVAKDFYAGDYTITIIYKALDEAYVEGASKGDKIADSVLTLHVKRCPITKPSADDTEFIYSGIEQTYDIPSNNLYEVTNDKRTKAGEQEVTVALKDINTYEWADGTTDNLKYTFHIEPKEIGLDWSQPNSFVYDGTAKKPTAMAIGLVLSDTVQIDVVLNNGSDINAGSFTYKATGIDNNNYKLPSSVVSDSYTIIPRPLLKGDFTVNTSGLVYTGNEIKPNVSSVQGLVTENDYTVSYENNVNAGTDTAKIKITGKNNASGMVEINFSIEKATPATNFPTGLNIGTDKKLSDITLPTGYTWDAPDTAVAYDSHEYPMTFTPVDTDNYNTVKANVNVTGNDVTAPTGKMEISENKWNTFWNGVTFGLFFKNTQTVTVTSGDTQSGVAKTEYFLSDKELSENEAKAIGNWTTFANTFNINPNNKYVVYVRITDQAGNAAIINSDGIVLDNILPVLSGIENDKTYYQEVEVTVTDTNLDKVTVNGEKVTVTDGKFKLTADDEVQKVKAFDKAGNVSAEIIVTVEAEHTFVWGEWYDNQNETHSKDAQCACGADLKITAPKKEDVVVDGLEEESVSQEKDLKLIVETNIENIDDEAMEAIQKELVKGITAEYIDITVKDVIGDVEITETTQVLEIPLAFDFTDKLNIIVYRNHGGEVKVLEELETRPVENFEDGTYYLDRENDLIYIYSNKFSTYGVTYHKHEFTHVLKKDATKEADGNIEYWYCEGCDKYFTDADGKNEISKEETIVKYVASPITGDFNNIWLWAMLLVISMAMLLGKGVLEYKRSKKRIR